MKKILVTLIVIILVVALLPMLGNSVAQKILKERVNVLTSNGLELKNETTESTYLKTKKHYEFSVLDAPIFIKHLNQYSDAQTLPYVDAMIEGAVLGVDVEYSNFPLSSKVSIDLYPLSLSTSMMDELKKDDIDFYSYVKNLLELKSVLYHINYNISDESFDGFIKDMDEEYSFDNGTKIKFKILDATYTGQGALIAPQNLHTNISNITVEVDTIEKSLVFKMHDLSTASIFESKSTYASSASIKTFLLIIKDTNTGKTEVGIEDAKLNISSNTQGKKAEFYAKSSLSKLKINSHTSHVVASGFNYDISLDGVDKDFYEEFAELTAHADANYSPEFEQKLQASVTKILSKGLILSIADLSVAKIGLENKTPIDGFSIRAKFTLKEDADLAKKLKTSPMSIADNLNVISTMKFSKDFYALINKQAPIIGLTNSFAKEEGNNLVFEIKLENGHLSVNDKAIN